jgi:hypothetical protein
VADDAEATVILEDLRDALTEERVVIYEQDAGKHDLTES